MRQLGARLPELPPVKTDVETPSEIQPHERHPAEAPEPYPVEVHRIERRPVRSAPAGASPPPSPEPVGVPQAVPESIAEPPAVAEAPPEPSAEPVVGMQVPAEATTHAVTETQTSPELSAAPVAAMQTTSEAAAEPRAETQRSPELSAESEAVTQAPPEATPAPYIETQASPPSPEPLAEPQAVPEPITAPPVASQVTPRSVVAPHAPPVSDVLRITEAPRSTPEPPLRRSTEPSPAQRLEGRSEGRPGLRSDLRPEIRSAAQELPEPNLGGRWAEFHDFRRIEPGRGSRISLEPMQPAPPAPRGLLTADREPEHRSSFLTIAVPGIAAILAVGALLWSGSLRDRVLRQDAEMTALQQQNRKLADTLAQMNVDQKVVGALNASGSAPTNAPDQTAQNPANSPAEQTQPQTSNPSGNDSARAANANGGAPAPVPKQASPSMGKREGVSAPPSIQSAQRRGSHRPVDTGYHPEIVPPYPTLSQPQNAAQAKSTSPAPVQQASHTPLPANSSASPAASSAAPTNTTQPSATPTRMAPSSVAPPSPPSGINPTTSYGIGSSPAYSATGNDVYANALAQNIEAVDSLQRQSQVPLREFHARDGVSVKITPGLFVSLRSPDQAHATYALLVSGSNGSYQLRGHVNSPLGFADNTTHRGYELMILRIAGQEAYGYLRPVQ